MKEFTLLIISCLFTFFATAQTTIINKNKGDVVKKKIVINNYNKKRKPEKINEIPELILSYDIIPNPTIKIIREDTLLNISVTAIRYNGKSVV